MTTDAQASCPQTLPVAVHADTASSRLCVVEMRRFETVLDAADAAVAIGLATQCGQPQGADDEPEGGGDDAKASLRAVLEAVSAATDGRPLPSLAAGNAALVRWTVDAVATQRRPEAARRGAKRGLDSDRIEACYELICKLNDALEPR